MVAGDVSALDVPPREDEQHVRGENDHQDQRQLDDRRSDLCARRWDRTCTSRHNHAGHAPGLHRSPLQNRCKLPRRQDFEVTIVVEHRNAASTRLGGGMIGARRWPFASALRIGARSSMAAVSAGTVWGPGTEMPGMGSYGTETIGGFYPYLFIDLLIIVALAWVCFGAQVGFRFLDEREGIVRRVAGAGLAVLPPVLPARLFLRRAIGVIWIADGLLQAQPAMPGGFRSESSDGWRGQAWPFFPPSSRRGSSCVGQLGSSGSLTGSSRPSLPCPGASPGPSWRPWQLVSRTGWPTC